MNLLLEWYASRREAYPWRGDSDPYRVLVSEVMLQQTQAARVAPVFESFVARFPSVAELARAPRGEVLRAWGSLGYNRRAVALHAAAREIMSKHDGVVPSDPDALRSLPGIGPYTASAVASLAFGAVVPAMDTNVGRVVARVRLGVDDGPRDAVSAAARRWIDRRRPGDWNQALMDLGREVCKPNPLCGECPLRRSCRFRRAGVGVRAPRRAQPYRGSSREARGAVMRILRHRGTVTLLRISAETELSIDRIAEAARALSAEGLVRAGPAALAGSPSGRVSLPT